MKHVRFVAEARLEFLSEVSYYNRAQEGLGARFAAAIEEAAARALVYPLAGTLSDRDRYSPRDGQRIPLRTSLPFAVANHLRQPNYWQERTKEY